MVISLSDEDIWLWLPVDDIVGLKVIIVLAEGVDQGLRHLHIYLVLYVQEVVTHFIC